MRLARPASLLLTAILLASSPARAQQGDRSRVQQAVELRDAGQFARAAELLRAHVAQHPDDVRAAELLGETLYWMKDVKGARAAFEAALARHPGSASLRLQYGRMLLETGDYARLEEVVGPMKGRTGGGAEALLGTAAYWNGDLSAARRLLRSSLLEDSQQPEVRRQLAEIAELTATWVTAGGDFASDDQPMRRANGVVELGWFATPSAVLTATAMAGTAASSDTLSVPVSLALLGVKLGGAALQLDLAGGMSSVNGAAAGIGHGRLTLRTGRHVKLIVAAEREPYLYTVSSLRPHVVADAFSARVALDHPRGWLGEAGHRRQLFPDDNQVQSSYAWLLAPLVRRGKGGLQVGYSISHQDAYESRYVPSTALYSPYYTPANLLSHSLIAAVALAPSPRSSVRLNGAYGLYAAEDAPVQPGTAVLPGPRGVRTVRAARRTFTPWRLRGDVGLPLAAHTALGIHAEASRSPLYTSFDAGVRLTYRLPRAGM